MKNSALIDTNSKSAESIILWDKYWRSGNPEYLCHKAITNRVLKATGNPNDVIVEIGSGLGVDAVEIASKGRTVIALDLSREALRLMKSNNNETSVMPVQADALSLPFKNDSIALVYHQGVMEHFADPTPFILEQVRSLKSGGILLVDVPQTFTLYTLKKKIAIARKKWFAGGETQYSPGRLRRVLHSNGLLVAEIYGRDYDFGPLVWLRDIRTLGSRRFGHPIIPTILSRPISWIWHHWESLGISNYIKHCIGAVAVKK